MAQLKEGSVIKKKTGDEIIATLADTLEIREMDALLFATLNAGIPIRREELDFIENENPFLLKIISNPSSTVMFFCYWDESGENLTMAPFNRGSGLKLFLPKDGSDGTSSRIAGDDDLLLTMVAIMNNRVKTDVPEGAKFTDTITTVNGKTGAIAKADIVALGIPAQDTVYTHPAGTNPHGTTKSDVGLSNVDNIKQMPISGGVLENYREALSTVGTNGIVNLNLANVFVDTPTSNKTYYFNNAVNGQAHSFTLIINFSSIVRTLTFPASVKWQGGEIPDMTTDYTTYVLTFMTIDGGTTWLGMFGGEF